MRLANLSTVLCMRMISTPVAKKFPTYTHIVQVTFKSVHHTFDLSYYPQTIYRQAGLMTESELVRLVSLEALTAQGGHQVCPTL